MNVNLFRDYHDCNPKMSSLREVVRIIREDASLKDRTLRHRYYLSQVMKKSADSEKQGCPCFGVATLFDGGKMQKHVCGWTGFGMVDVDHIAPEQMSGLVEKAAADAHALLVYVTVSGKGLRILFRYAAEGMDTLDFKLRKELYEVAFQTANAHFQELLGVKPDPKCKTCTQLSGLAHDPNVHFRPEAEPFTLSLPALHEEVKRKRSHHKLLLRAVRAARQELVQEGVRFEPGNHNQYVMRMGYLLNAYGVPEEDATLWAVREFSDDYDGDVAGIFASCYKQTAEHASRRLPSSNDREKVRWADVKEIEQFLLTQVELRFNVIRHQCEIRWKSTGEEAFTPITDRDENTLWCRMKKEGVEVKLQDMRNVLHSEFVPPFHPFEEYFNSLPPWDGVDHIGQLARTVHVKGDQEQFVEYFRKWFVGILPNIFNPNVVNHEIMVFIGRQGNYKSTFFSLLLPPCLQSYFHIQMNKYQLTKDDMLGLCEFALVCLEEIGELRPTTLDQLKAMVTDKIISERAAYARNKEHRPHIASFCGTGNNPRFLTDPTGNRRWLVFEVEDIDNPYQYPFNYTGIYSQALALWKSGFCYWFDQPEIDVLNERNKDFEVPNLEEELLLTYFRLPFEGCKASFMKVAEILERINSGVRQPLSPTRLGMAMRQLGFPSLKQKGVRGYLVVERSLEEIQASRRLLGNV